VAQIVHVKHLPNIYFLDTKIVFDKDHSQPANGPFSHTQINIISKFNLPISIPWRLLHGFEHG